MSIGLVTVEPYEVAQATIPFYYYFTLDYAIEYSKNSMEHRELKMCILK